MIAIPDSTRVCRLYGKGDIRLETDALSAHDPLAPGEVLVRIGAGGICGSDLHYYLDGGFGPIRVKEPIILGHEIAGTVVACGSDDASDGLVPGQRVALNPSRACGRCEYCQRNLFNHCLAMRFYGSALRFPHEQGAFRDFIVADRTQCVAVSDATALSHAACAEPLAVCLHAMNQAGADAGALRDKRVLITGAGPIGSLCTAAAKRAGAAEVIVTDLQDVMLAIAARMGADHPINVGNASPGEADPLAAWKTDKGQVDIVFECSAAAPALEAAIHCVRPGGIIVQVGVTGNLPIPINLLVGKEITLRGTHRFHAEFAEAVRCIDSGDIDVAPIITECYPAVEFATAFEVASDRSRGCKVQLVFDQTA